jgi:hypothetical protein
LYLDIRYILITSTRFERNNANNFGDDIRTGVVPCFLGVSGGEDSLASTCSTTEGNDRVRCNFNTNVYLLDNCPTEIYVLKTVIVNKKSKFLGVG